MTDTRDISEAMKLFDMLSYDEKVCAMECLRAFLEKQRAQGKHSEQGTGYLSMIDRT